MVAPEYVVVGRVRKAHGIRGELVVESLTSDPTTHFAIGAQLTGEISERVPPGDVVPERPTLTIRRATPFKGGWILRLAEIADRTAAEQWRGRYLLVPASALQPPTADEVYFHELEGLRVELRDGVLLGRVAGLYEVPQGLLLEVQTDRGPVMVPYRPEVVVEVDVPRGAVVVNPPAGLFD